jgi:hypothetical protein
MTTTDDTTARTRWITYVVIGVIVVVLVVVGLAVFRSAKASAAAEDKADQLVSELEGAGLPTPSKDQIVHVLGDDGGAICENPNSALKRAILYGMLSNGSGGPGIRPIIADNKVLQGQLLVVKIYCPNELPDVVKFIDDLKTADVVKD